VSIENGRHIALVRSDATIAGDQTDELLTETTGGETTYYHYDGRGNTVAKQESAGTTYFAYSTENLMTRIDLAGGGHSYYEYDADGKRVRIHPHNVTPTVFIYEGPDMLRLQMEKRDNEDTVAQYTIGARGGLEAQRRGEDTSVYHFDMLGSTLALTGANEAVTDTLRYEAWGDVLASTGNTTNRHTWVGRERYVMTRSSDIALLGLRYYMPSIGRFTTVDLLGSGSNWFAYVHNRVLVLIDPAGLLSSPGHCQRVGEGLDQYAEEVRTCPFPAACQELNDRLYRYLHDCYGFIAPPSDPRPFPYPPAPEPLPFLPTAYEVWLDYCHMQRPPGFDWPSAYQMCMEAASNRAHDRVNRARLACGEMAWKAVKYCSMGCLASGPLILECVLLCIGAADLGISLAGLTQLVGAAVGLTYDVLRCQGLRTPTGPPQLPDGAAPGPPGPDLGMPGRGRPFYPV